MHFKSTYMTVPTLQRNPASFTDPTTRGGQNLYESWRELHSKPSKHNPPTYTKQTSPPHQHTPHPKDSHHHINMPLTTTIPISTSKTAVTYQVTRSIHHHRTHPVQSLQLNPRPLRSNRAPSCDLVAPMTRMEHFSSRSKLPLCHLFHSSSSIRVHTHP